MTYLKPYLNVKALNSVNERMELGLTSLKWFSNILLAISFYLFADELISKELAQHGSFWSAVVHVIFFSFLLLL